jgi:hypothetical protein
MVTTFRQMLGNSLYIMILCFLSFYFLGSCKKLVSIPVPINSITAEQVFNDDNDATSAVIAIYSYMSYGGTYNGLVFSNGGTTIYPGLSADELTDFFPGSDEFLSNTLVSYNTTPYLVFWQPAYFDIYMANAVISDLQASTGVTPTTKTQLIGEAEFLRALCYFNLVNVYGGVPLSLSTDFHQTSLLARASESQVYQQIVMDLQDAEGRLATDFSFSNGLPVRANKWAAAALLARAYLYNKNWDKADSAASAVINSGNFRLLPTDSLNQVFLANSNEAILQFQTLDGRPWATQEGYTILPAGHGGAPNYLLQESLIAAFEPGDQRWTLWVDSINLGGTPYYCPFKYQIRQGTSGNITENYTVLRLAEQYLIRAEAEANGAEGGNTAAIADLNILRMRANLPPLPDTLSNVMGGVVQERRIELFAEWGHRWFDLKRWGTAVSTLGSIPDKSGNIDNDQLLYPIPLSEIQTDPSLMQNPGYSSH